MDTPAPCRTLYIRNLPEKLKKIRLRRLLHAAFSPYGRIVQIVAEKSLKLRGQAFLTFENQTGATSALRKLHATSFMGKQIVVTYARELSDAAGSPKLGGDSDLTRKKRAAKRKEESAAKKARLDETPKPEEPEIKPTPDEPPPQIPAAPPNRILFLQNLPGKITVDGKDVSKAEGLSDLFTRFSGFVEVRMVPGKEDIAFVEFSSEAESAVALGGLQGHLVGTPQQPLNISFAKK